MLTLITGILKAVIPCLVPRVKQNPVQLGLLLACSLFVTNGVFAAEPDLSPTTVVATINGIPLRLKAYGFFLKEARSEVIGEISQRPDTNLEQQDLWNSTINGVTVAELVKRKALAQATEYYAFLAKGVELGLAKAPEDPLAQSDLSELQKNKTIYGPAVLSEVMVVSAFRDTLRTSIKERMVPESAFSEEEIRHYYDQDPKLHVIRSAILIRKIYLSYQDTDREQKDALMQILLQRVNAGEDFAALAKQYSEPFIENGWVNHDKKGRQIVTQRRMEDTFLKENFFNMSAGEVRGVLDNGKGFYLVKCEEALDMPREFTDVRSSILGMFVQNKYSEITREIITNATVEINPEVFSAVKVN